MSASGTAPPVICLHGLFESPAIWRPVRRRLARAGRRSLALPLPGHRRDAPDYEQTREILAGRGLANYLAERIARKTNGGPAYLLGHSMGGLLALLIARAHPSLVERIMVVGAPHAGHAGRSGWLDPRMLADIPVVSHVSARVLLSRWLADPERFEAGLHGALASDERIARVPRRMRHELRSGCPSAMHEMLVWLRAQDVLESLGSVAAPVTVMILAEDPVVAPEHQMELVRALPNASALVMRCGHLPMLTAPDLFERCVLDWASQPVGARAPDAAGRASDIARDADSRNTAETERSEHADA